MAEEELFKCPKCSATSDTEENCCAACGWNFVAAGGHQIPLEDIIAMIHKSLESC